MKLLIISDMAHYLKNEQVVGHGPTARELSYLSTLFDEVRHVACLHPGLAPALMLPYAVEKIHLVAVPPAGGNRFHDKLHVLRLLPLYVRTIRRELQDADVVHIRCAANISLIAIVLLAFVRKPRLRWIKYANNWQPSKREALSYTFQRWWLKRNFARAQVTVNGFWPRQPSYIHSFFNPCLTEEEIREAERGFADRELNLPLQILYVGRLEDEKGVGRALLIAARLHELNVPFHFDLIGDDPARPVYEALASQLGIAPSTSFHGWLSRADLNGFYGQAHLLLFPTSCSEGWPKVISEAMAYGVVPIVGAVSSIAQYLGQFGTGRALLPEATEEFVATIKWYVDHPSVWKHESRNGVKTAPLFSYAHYLQEVQKLLHIS